MIIRLQGGRHDGLEMEIPDSMELVVMPHVVISHNHAEPVTPLSVKRHTWDEDALIFSYDRYRRTDLAVNGRIIYTID